MRSPMHVSNDTTPLQTIIYLSHPLHTYKLLSITPFITLLLVYHATRVTHACFYRLMPVHTHSVRVS